MANAWPDPNDPVDTDALDADSDTVTGAGGGREQILGAVQTLNTILAAVDAGASVFSDRNSDLLALLDKVNVFTKNQIVEKATPAYIAKDNAGDMFASYDLNLGDDLIGRLKCETGSNNYLQLERRDQNSGYSISSWIRLYRNGNVDIGTNRNGEGGDGKTHLYEFTGSGTLKIDGVLVSTLQTAGIGSLLKSTTDVPLSEGVETPLGTLSPPTTGGTSAVITCEFGLSMANDAKAEFRLYRGDVENPDNRVSPIKRVETYETSGESSEDREQGQECFMFIDNAANGQDYTLVGTRVQGAFINVLDLVMEVRRS